MKNLTYAIGLALLGLLMTSCSTSKKYNDALSSKAALEERHEELQENYSKLKAEQSATANELANTEMKLALEESENQELKSTILESKQAVLGLKEQICSALKCFTKDEMEVTVRGGELYISLSDKLLFPSGSDQLNERGEMALEMLADVLKDSETEVRVEGHTDNVPIKTNRARDNWDLSTHRATTVTRILVDNGMKPERIIASGRSEFDPVAGNKSLDGRQENRRTEIVLAPDLAKIWELAEDEALPTTVIIEK